VLPYAAWKENLSQPVFDTILRETAFLTAEDGTSLSLRVYRPADAGDKKLPTLLQITPYQTLDRAFFEAFGYEPAEYWPARGVVFVEADARGTHSSGGCLDFGGEKDRNDARKFGEWIVAQPWSDGRLMVEGVSHPGMGVLVAAVAGVPGYAGGFAHAPVSSYYMDEWMNGAKFDTQLNGPAYTAIETLPTFDADPASLANQFGGTCQGDTMLQFSTGDGTLTPWFKEKDLNLLTGNVDQPLLLTIGFLDMNVFPDHVHRFWEGIRHRSDARLIMGYWVHGYPVFDGYRIEDYGDYQQRWIDAALLNVSNGLDAEPRVVIEDNRGGWHELSDWPPPLAVNTTLYATTEGTLAAEAPGEGEASWVDDPQATRDRWPANAHLLFATEPLAEDQWITGSPYVELVASSSADWTKYVAYLFDVAPDGSRMRVSHGYIDSRFPNGLEQAAPPAPGEKARYAFHLLPTAHVVEKGNQLALVVASSDNALTDEGYTQCPETPSGGCYNPSGIQPSPDANARNTAYLGVDGTRVSVWVAAPGEGLLEKGE
ncbi:MAG TPA: CocE/NonD family hydrolase, partial [Candidatus Thermoplasmatota archaeon]|nr:CocE/NonD family hydrolase [Candidatus Thermoplasmatota archaeon]